jgi:thioredoxin 1
MTTPYEADGPTREQIDAATGPLLLNFGTNWCGHCQVAAPLVDEALAGRPDVRHIKVEDGPGRPLGRSYRVKLWPTLIFIQDGVEVARAVRPETLALIRDGLEQLA